MSERPTVAGGASIAELAASLSDRELGVMMHATGWQSRQPLYRNHYCAGEGHHNWSTIQTLVECGLMRCTSECESVGDAIRGGDKVFAVTAIGIATLRGKGKGCRAQSGDDQSE